MKTTTLIKTMNYNKINQLAHEYANGTPWPELELLMKNMTTAEIEYAEGVIGVVGCLID